LPVFLALEGKRAMIAGGNAAAAWKAELLSAAGANVDVITEEPCDELVLVASDPPHGTIVIHRRAWAAEDIAGAAIAIGAFNDDEQAAEFAKAARAAGVPVNVIDKPAFCDFAFGSIVNRSPLVIGISTDGAAPVFAQAIRAKLEALLPQGFALWAKAAARWRSALKATELSFAARREAKKMLVGKTGYGPSCKQDDINALMINLAKSGKRVVRLKGGDPLIF